MVTVDSMQRIIKPDKYQKQVLSYIECGDSLFVTGKAGTGKTHVLKILKEKCEGKKVVAVLAPTGVAARNAGGFTMHSFLRLPVGAPYLPDHKIKPDLYQLSDISAETIRSIDILVIDEIYNKADKSKAELRNSIDAIDKVIKSLINENL